MLGRFSLGTIGLSVGGVLTIIGFVAYYYSNATLNLIGFFYGIPILLGGLALKAAELEPVPLETPSEDVLALREQQATDTLNQVRKDVTRYRYGQKAHLDSTLSHLGLSPTDEERPQLVGLREESRDGAYTLVMQFNSPMMSLDAWRQKHDKMERFFGPGVHVDLDQPVECGVEVKLIVSPSEAA